VKKIVRCILISLHIIFIFSNTTDNGLNISKNYPKAMQRLLSAFPVTQHNSHAQSREERQSMTTTVTAQQASLKFKETNE